MSYCEFKKIADTSFIFQLTYVNPKRKKINSWLSQICQGNSEIRAGSIDFTHYTN